MERLQRLHEGLLLFFSTSILFLFFLPLVSARAGGDPIRCSQVLTQQDSSSPNLSSSSNQLQRTASPAYPAIFFRFNISSLLILLTGQDKKICEFLPF